MYAVYFKGRRLKSLGKHFSYDEARAAARRYIRMKVRQGTLSRENFGFWDDVSRNPVRLVENGFTIKMVA